MADSVQPTEALSNSESSSREVQEVWRRRIDIGAAQLLAWVVLALVNQPLIVLLLPAAGAKVRALHQLYDAGQLLLLGLLSWAAVRAVRVVEARWQPVWLAAPWSRSVLTGAAVQLVGLVIARNDVANLASRVEVPHWLLTVGMATTFAVVLGASQLGRPVTTPWLRALLVTGGAAVAVVNAVTLKGDYFAHHLLTAWLAALLIGRGLEGLPLPALSGLQARSCLAVLGAICVLSVALPPKGDVRLRLYELPSSVLAPLTARFLSDEQGVVSAGAAEESRNSPWFRERSQLGPVAPTRAILPAKPPIVMFFTIDAFRANVMEDAKLRADLPELERLRKASTYFRVARSPTASTMTTMASVFSGRYYTQLHWGTVKATPLLEPTPRFPELVAEKGVRTLLVAGTLGQIYGSSGVARGFATEIAVPGKRQPATVTVDAIIKQLDNAPDGPQLIYSHFIEPHAPYDLAGKKGTQFARYLREIRLVDTQLARLRAYLEDKGLADRTYMIISADHGEGFGEHGTFNHAATAYEELVRVPLFFYVPGREGRLLDTPVSLMDVGPTILDLFGLPTPGFWMGQSLLPLVAGTATKLDRPVIVDTGRRVQAFCFDDGLKVIFARTKHTTEAYDLKRDPGELVNLAGKNDPAIDSAVQIADLFFRGIALPEMDQDFRE
jgi:hypothetical protein